MCEVCLCVCFYAFSQMLKKTMCVCVCARVQLHSIWNSINSQVIWFMFVCNKENARTRVTPFHQKRKARKKKNKYEFQLIPCIFSLWVDFFFTRILFFFCFFCSVSFVLFWFYSTWKYFKFSGFFSGVVGLHLQFFFRARIQFLLLQCFNAQEGVTSLILRVR